MIFIMPRLVQVQMEHLKVVVSSNDNYLDNDVRMWSRNNVCPITIGTGEFWNVSFYVKGEIGQELQFVLIDGTSYGTSLGDNHIKSDIKDGIT